MYKKVCIILQLQVTTKRESTDLRERTALCVAPKHVYLPTSSPLRSTTTPLLRNEGKKIDGLGDAACCLYTTTWVEQKACLLLAAGVYIALKHLAWLSLQRRPQPEG